VRPLYSLIERLSNIQRASKAQPVFACNMRVDHCGLNIGVAEQFLDGSDIISVFQKMGCKAVPKSVNRDRLWNIGFLCGRFDLFLKGAGMNMMSSNLTASGVDG